MEQQDKKVPLLDAFLVIITTFFLIAFTGAFLLLTVGTGPALVIGELLILIIPLVYLIFRRINIKKYVQISFNPKYILIGLALGALIFLLDILVSGALVEVFGTSEAVNQANQQIIETSATTLGMFYVATSLILAGICEEFAFRGFLQKALTQRYSAAPAIIISAVIFGLFHFDPQGVYIISATISGLVLGLLFYRWNYTVAATAHAITNIIVLAALIFGF